MDPKSGQRSDAATSVARFVDALRDHAQRTVPRRSWLQPDDALEIVQQAFQELLEEYGPFPPLPTLERARRTVERVADRLQQRRKRRAERNRQAELGAHTKRRGRQGNVLEVVVDPKRPVRNQPVGVPTLCGHFVRLGRGIRFETEIARLVVQAAAVVVADPRAFSAQEIALFTLAWRNGLSAARIVGAAETKTPRAVTERLKRISNKIENHLVEYVAATLPADCRGRLEEMFPSEPAARKRGRSANHFDAEVYERILAALEGLTREFPS